MKVKIVYSIDKCHEASRNGDECPFVADVEWRNGHSVCENYEQEDDNPETCQYLYSLQMTEAREIKNIEILKDYEEGYVKIGRKVYPLKDVELLQVDYGEGYVTEWSDDYEWQEHNLPGSV